MYNFPRFARHLDVDGNPAISMSVARSVGWFCFVKRWGPGEENIRMLFLGNI